MSALILMPYANVAAQSSTPTPTPGGVRCLPDCNTILDALKTRGAGDVIVKLNGFGSRDMIITALKNQPSSGYTTQATVSIMSPFKPYIVFGNVTPEGFETVLLRLPNIDQVSLDTPDSPLFGLELEAANFNDDRDKEIPIRFTFGRTALTNQPLCSPDCNTLLKKTAARPISVIVTLAISEEKTATTTPRPATGLPPADPTYQVIYFRPLGYRFAQAELIAAMRKAGLQLGGLQTFPYVAAIVVTADETTLQFLMNRISVANIAENQARSFK